MTPVHDEAFHAILEAKYARIISAISELHSISLEEAMDIFYHSPLLPLIEDGVETYNAAATNTLPRKYGSKGRKRILQ